MPTRKRKKKTTAGPVGIGTTESDEEVDKLIEEAEEGSSVLRHLNLSLWVMLTFERVISTSRKKEIMHNIMIAVLF